MLAQTRTSRRTAAVLTAAQSSAAPSKLAQLIGHSALSAGTVRLRGRDGSACSRRGTQRRSSWPWGMYGATLSGPNGPCPPSPGAPVPVAPTVGGVERESAAAGVPAALAAAGDADGGAFVFVLWSGSGGMCPPCSSETFGWTTGAAAGAGKKKVCERKRRRTVMPRSERAALRMTSLLSRKRILCKFDWARKGDVAPTAKRDRKRQTP